LLWFYAGSLVRCFPTLEGTYFCLYLSPPGPWAKSDEEKAELFAEHLSEVFSPHNNDQGQKVKQELATPIQSQERLKALTLKEIKEEIKMLTKKRHRVSTLLLPECQNNYQKKDL
jgi:hypothetical protein